MRDDPRHRAVIGIGNPLRGDDGVGPRLIEVLRRHPLPDDIVLIDLGLGGLDLLPLLEEGWEKVIIVDAADLGCPPGSFRCFTPQEARLLREDSPLTLHNAGVSEVLALAEALERPLPPMLIFGVQPSRLEWVEGLSREVERALPALAEAVLKAVN